MINILFITYGLEKNGTEEFIMNVLRGLDKEHFHADFLLFSEDSQAQYANRTEAESFGAKIYRLPSRRNGLRYYKSLNHFFKEKRGVYNAVHWNEGNMSTIMPIFYAWKYDVPVRIIHAHNSDAKGFLTKLQHWCNKKFNLRYCTHRFACSSLAAKFFFDEKDSLIIKNGILIDRFLYNNNVRKQKRDELHLMEESFVIGHVGSFNNIKNQTFLIDIFYHLQKKDNNARLVLIGVGESLDYCKHKVKTLDIIDKVIFLGLQANVNEWMQAFDVFVMPSIYEGLPFVLVEAQTASLPCVIADTINQDAAITNNVSFVSLENSIDMWLKTILGYKGAIREDNALVISNNGFSIASTVNYLEKIYAGL